MLDKLKSIAKQSFVYGIGNVLNKLLGFILIPMYMKHIPIGDFGNLVYLETLIVFLSTFVGFGIGPAHQRFFYTEHENKTYGVYLFNIFFGCILISFLTLLPTIIYSDNLALFLCKDQSRSLIFQIGMWIVLVEVIYSIPLYILQYEEKPVQYLIFNIIKLTLSFGLTIFMVTSLSMGIEGMFTARLIGGGVTLLIATFFVVIPRCKFSLNIESIIKSIKFGLPYVISNIGFTMFIISDRIMLNWLNTPEQVGKYGFGFRIANFINLIFIQTIGQSYFPSVMSNEKKENNIRYYRKMLTYYCFLMALLILGFLFTYKDFLQILGKNKDYWEGLNVVPMLALSFMVGGMNYFVGVGLFLSNKTKYFLIPSFAALFVNFGLNLYLIPNYGMMGAAFSVFAAQVIYSSTLSFLSGKFYEIKFEWGKVILICMIAITIYFIGQLISGYSLWIIFPIRLSLMMLFPFILYKLHFFEAIEIQRLKDGFFKLKRMVKL
jgi:O-antigen/teichoic acid export membrane protein